MRRHGLEYILLLVVLGIAAYLRMGWPDVIEFKRDEANLSLLALDFATGKVFPLLGITSSVGFPNAPFNVYVLAIPYFFTSSPVVATQFIGFLNVIAVGLMYVFLRRYTHWSIALTLTLLFAVAPWGIIFSRKIWAQNMLPAFVLLTLLTGLWAWIDDKKWAHVLHPILLVILGQIHYGAFVMIPAYAVLWVAGRRNFSRHTIAGIIIALVLCLPYLMGLYQGGFLSPDTLRRVFSQASVQDEPSEDSLFTLSPVREAGVIISGTEIHALAGHEVYQDYLAQIPQVYPLFGIITYAVLVSCLWLTIRVVRYKYERRIVDIIVCVWLIFPIVSFIVTWTTFYIHYLIPMLPAAFIAIGLAVSDLLNAIKSRKIVKNSVIIVGGVGVVIISLLQITLFANLLNFLYDNHTPGGFGTPIGYLNNIRDYILKQDARYVIGQLEGQMIGFDDDATIFAALLYDVPNLRFEDDQTQVYRDEKILLFAADDRYETCFNLRPGEGCYSVGYRNALGNLSNEAIITFNNGVEVLSYNWDETTNCITVRWKITQLANREYAFSIHGFDINDERQTIADAISWFARYWQVDDVIDRQFCLQGDIHYILLGMYHLRPDNTFEGIQIRDTFDQSIRIDVGI